MAPTKNKFGIQYEFWSKDRIADFVPHVSKVAKLGFDIMEISSFALMEEGAMQPMTAYGLALMSEIHISRRDRMGKTGFRR